MEYTDVEKRVLDIMKRTDFKSLSKNDVISYTSRLSELRPEIATQIIAQFPELAKLIQNSMVEYKHILEQIVVSDDESTNQVYATFNKQIDTADASRKEYMEFADKVRLDLSKCLNNPNLTVEQQKEIRQQEMEILRMITEKDSEIREQEMEITRRADKKDSEKKVFNWKVIGTASIFVLTVVGIGTASVGGNFNIKIPKKS